MRNPVFKRPRSRVAIAALLLLAAAATRATPATPATRAYGGDGPYGGCVSCLSHSFDQRNDDATPTAPAVGGSVGDIGGDGSYGHASAWAQLGQLHAYADAHRTSNGNFYAPVYPAGDAQSSATARFTDYLLPAHNDPSIHYANYLLTLNLTGSHSSQDNALPNSISAVAQISWDIRDELTGHVYANGNFDTTDAQPTKLAQIPVTGVVATDPMSIEVSLSDFAYVMSTNQPNYLTAVVDYSDTLDVNLDALTPGASTVGATGFDYASPSAVPEPAAGLLCLAGLIAIACRARRLAVHTGSPS